MQFSLYTVMIFVLTVGSYVIITTKGLDLDVGQFSALLTYSFQILSSLMMLSMVFVMVAMSMASARRISEVLNETSDLKNPEHPALRSKLKAFFIPTISEITFPLAGKCMSAVTVQQINKSTSSGFKPVLRNKSSTALAPR